MKKKLLCTIFGHKPCGLNVKRMFARCCRCDIGLKVSYDMGYGDTLIVGDYGEQTTFAWCECGNELCSTNSNVGLLTNGLELYKCSSCGNESKWDFDAPVPISI